MSSEGMQPDLNRWRVLLRYTDGTHDITLGAPAGVVAIALIAVMRGDVVHTLANEGLSQVINIIGVLLRALHLIGLTLPPLSQSAIH